MKEQDFDSIELTETIQDSFDCSDLENPMGEGRKDALRVNFERKRKGARRDDGFRNYWLT